MPAHRKRAGEVAFAQMKRLTKIDSWIEDPQNALMVCSLLAETGNQIPALEQVKRVPKTIRGILKLFFFLPVCPFTSRTPPIAPHRTGITLLSAQRDQTGIEAIRHMTLLHLMQPLSPSSLDKCIELLQVNKQAQPIDFLRIHALASLRLKAKKKKEIIKSCSGLFDLNNPADLLTFQIGSPD